MRLEGADEVAQCRRLWDLERVDALGLVRRSMSFRYALFLSAFERGG